MNALQTYISSHEYAKVAILGMGGTGKTYLASTLDFPVQRIFYLDVVGAFRKFLGAAPDMQIFEGRIAPEASAIKPLLAHYTARRFIFDISLMRRSEMVKLADNLAEYLLIENKQNCAMLVDECGELLPQDGGYYSEMLESCIRIGRNRGMTFSVLTSQRPQKVNKNALALSDIYCILRTKHYLDLEQIRNLLGLGTKEFYEEEAALAPRIKALQMGQYMLTDGLATSWHGGEK